MNNYLQAIEQLTMTQLRQVIGGMELETTLTSRERINGALASELDAATGKWGIKVKRVELKGIDPPASIQDSMEKQMRAERDKRAAVLNAEGVRQSQVLTADGEKQGNILRAQGEREAMILRAQASRESEILKAQGQAQAISTVFSAIHAGRPDAELLSYQYLQMLPEIAKGDSNKLWIVPSELGKALEGLGGALGGLVPKPESAPAPSWQPPADQAVEQAPPPMPADLELPEPGLEGARSRERGGEAGDRRGREHGADVGSAERPERAGTARRDGQRRRAPGRDAGLGGSSRLCADAPSP